MRCLFLNLTFLRTKKKKASKRKDSSLSRWKRISLLIRSSGLSYLPHSTSVSLKIKSIKKASNRSWKQELSFWNFVILRNYIGFSIKEKLSSLRARILSDWCSLSSLVSLKKESSSDLSIISPLQLRKLKLLRSIFVCKLMITSLVRDINLKLT